MTLKQYLSIMIMATVMCWISWGMVIINVDPEQSGAVGFLFFYASLFLSLLGSFSLLMFLLYYSLSKDKYPIFRHVQKSFRDALIFASSIETVLYLLSINFLNLWNLSILAAISVFMFVFSVSKQKIIQN